MIGGLRLALLTPLYICLVVVDEKAHWTALGLYLFSILAGLLAHRLAHPRTALGRIGDSLVLVVMSLGLVVGGVTTIGSAAACAILIGWPLVRLELARADPVRFAIVGPRPADAGLAVLTVSSFVLLLAPHIIGVPKVVDTHRLGGFLLMICGGLALVSLIVEVARGRR